MPVAMARMASTANAPVPSKPAVTSGTPTALTVTMAATERSMPPAMTTKVWPTATRPITAASSIR